MLRIYMKSKLHRLTLTGTELNYEGSIELDSALIEAADMAPWEKVQVLNLSNGARFETYIIPAPSDSGIVRLNGPAARLGTPGDLVIVVSYALMDKREAADYRPIVVYVDSKNRAVESTQ